MPLFCVCTPGKFVCGKFIFSLFSFIFILIKNTSATLHSACLHHNVFDSWGQRFNERLKKIFLNACSQNNQNKKYNVYMYTHYTLFWNQSESILNHTLFNMYVYLHNFNTDEININQSQKFACDGGWSEVKLLFVQSLCQVWNIGTGRVSSGGYRLIFSSLG